MKNALDEIVKVASKMVRVQFSSLNHIFNKQVLNKAMTVRSEGGRPLHVHGHETQVHHHPCLHSSLECCWQEEVTAAAV